MAESTLSKDELTALRVLAFFFYQCGNARAAEHAAKAVLAVQPEDVWAQQFLVLCADSAEVLTKCWSLRTNPNSWQLCREMKQSRPGRQSRPQHESAL